MGVGTVRAQAPGDRGAREHLILAGTGVASGTGIPIDPRKGRSQMMSGIFRRRVVVIAAGLVAGSALAAGVPSLVLHNPHSSVAAATATITLNTSQFGALTFAHLGGITNDEQDQQSCSSGSCTYTPTAV